MRSAWPRSRIVVIVIGIAAALLTARLGWWQLDRAQQRRALAAQAHAQAALAPIGERALAERASDAPAQVGRRAVLSGRWMGDATVWLANRTMDGQAGFFVITPLRLADGSAVLVQRGFQARDARDPMRTQMPVTPAVAVRVEGTLATGLSRMMTLGPEAAGAVRQNLELDDVARELRVPVRPVVLVQTQPEVVLGSVDADVDGAAPAAAPVSASGAAERSSRGAASAAGGSAVPLLRHWAAPDDRAERNDGYAFQWFALSATLVALLLWFQVLRPRRRTASGNG